LIKHQDKRQDLGSKHILLSNAPLEPMLSWLFFFFML